jgi:hypothetical protein
MPDTSFPSLTHRQISLTVPLSLPTADSHIACPVFIAVTQSRTGHCLPLDEATTSKEGARIDNQTTVVQALSDWLEACKWQSIIDQTHLSHIQPGDCSPRPTDTEVTDLSWCWHSNGHHPRRLQGHGPRLTIKREPRTTICHPVTSEAVDCFESNHTRHQANR